MGPSFEASPSVLIIVELDMIYHPNADMILLLSLSKNKMTASTGNDIYPIYPSWVHSVTLLMIGLITDKGVVRGTHISVRCTTILWQDDTVHHHDQYP